MLFMYFGKQKLSKYLCSCLIAVILIVAITLQRKKLNIILILAATLTNKNCGFDDLAVVLIFKS